MQTITVVLLILGVAVSSTWANCWWTGCQPNHWGVKGCSQYDRDERGNRGCRDNQGAVGKEYHCCEKGTQSGGGGPPPHEVGTKIVSYDRFRNAVTNNGGRTPTKDHYNNFNNYARSLGRISTVQEAAMALAQILHESDRLRAKREYACAETQCPNKYRNSCDRPGQYYYGRGYIQLTHCYNYGPASQAIFNDDRLLRNPDQVATNDQIAWQTTFWYWGTKVHDKPGVQQGQFGATTRWINGDECRDPNNQTPKNRFQMYGIVRQAFGLHGSGDPSGCTL